MPHSMLGPLADPTRLDDIALVDAGSERTWSDVAREIAAVAGAMRASVGAGDGRWGILGDNAGPTVLAHAAGILAGVGTVALSRQATLAELADQIEDSGIVGLIAGPSGLPVAVEALAAGLVPVVVGHSAPVEDAASEDRSGLVSWDAWIAAAPEWLEESRPPRPPMVYTSGTTGRARATEVRWVIAPVADHRAFVDRLRARAQFPPGPHLVVGPLQHNGPLAAVRHLIGGEPVVVMQRFDPEAALAAIERHGIVSSVMVPTHFQRLLSLPPETRSRYSLGSLQLIAHTGSACPPQVKRDMIAWLGPILLESYGGSESGTLCRISSTEWLEHPGSVGRAVEPYTVRVFSEDGDELPEGSVGVLGFEAPEGHGVRYHRDEAKTAKAYLRPGVFTLGDVGYVDAEGFVFVTDRVSDMVVSGGVNLYPSESEAVLREQDGVADVAVIGVPHPDLGEQLLALVVPVDPASPPDGAVLEAACRERLAAYKVPRRYEYLASLPRNEMQKVDKKALRRPYWEQA